MKVLLYIETKEGMPIGSSLELFQAASSISAKASAVLIGANEEAGVEVAKWGAESVIMIDGAGVDVNGASYITEDEILCGILQAISENEASSGEKFAAVLLAATNAGKILAPRIAECLSAGAVNDAISLSVKDNKITAIRPVYGGTIRQEIQVGTELSVISIRGGSYEKPSAEVSDPVKPVHVALKADEKAIRTKILEIIEEAGEAVNLEDAKVIVSGGRGMGTPEGFKLCEDLAELLDGVVGATRPAIENGWIGRTHQVGQSGKIVAPDLYIACGVSGATQHLSGMTGSKYIIAINKDADAPIFSVADVGIVGDAKQILPLFIEEVKKRKAAK